MKALCASILFMLGCQAVHAQSAPAHYDSVIQRLGKEFARDTSTAGLSVGILYGNQSWLYNFGKGDPGKHSLYEIGSITKTFTSLVLAHAVGQGKVSLTDDIRQYLDGSYPNLVYQGEPIRLVHLANTSSGLPDNLFTGADTGRTRQDFFKALSFARLDTLPGTKPRHSNAGATLLALILENVYKEPIEVLIKRLVLDPLQMTNTGFALTGQAPSGMMSGYNSAGHTMPYISGALVSGTGGMRSSTADMVKYLGYLQAHRDAASDLVLTPTITVDAGTNTVTETVPIATVNDRVYDISLNWLFYHPAKGQLRIWTDGGTFGFRSYIVLYPEKDLSFIFLSNRTGEKILDKMYTIAVKLFTMIEQP